MAIQLTGQIDKLQNNKRCLVARFVHIRIIVFGETKVFFNTVVQNCAFQAIFVFFTFSFTRNPNIAFSLSNQNLDLVSFM